MGRGAVRRTGAVVLTAFAAFAAPAAVAAPAGTAGAGWTDLRSRVEEDRVGVAPDGDRGPLAVTPAFRHEAGVLRGRTIVLEIRVADTRQGLTLPLAYENCHYSPTRTSALCVFPNAVKPGEAFETDRPVQVVNAYCCQYSGYVDYAFEAWDAKQVDWYVQSMEAGVPDGDGTRRLGLRPVRGEGEGEGRWRTLGWSRPGSIPPGTSRCPSSPSAARRATTSAWTSSR
jgi:hypothetical protein